MSTRMMMATMILWIGGMVGMATGASEYLSPQEVVASEDGKTLYLSQATADAIGVFDIASGKLAKQIAVPGTPAGLALDSKAGRLYVAIAAVKGTVCAVDLAGGKVVDTFAAGHTPVAVVLSPDGKTLFVCNRFGASVSVVDLAAKKAVATIAVQREPVAAALTTDSKWLFEIGRASCREKC
jgi:YVTN family beta-propeller protein